MNVRKMFGMLIVGAFGMGFAFASMSNAADEQKNEPKELAQARADYESKIAPIKRTYVQKLEQLKKSFGAKGDTAAMNAVQEEIDELSASAAEGKASKKSQLSGKWKISYSNGATREYEFKTGNKVFWENKKGEVEWKRSNVAFIDFKDAKLERWTNDDGEWKVEHFLSPSYAPGSKPAITGIAIELSKER